tara:strand:+ start:1064 stop:2587 length:1524 start_codon:yes stop_codon:yes gene_type:complete
MARSISTGSTAGFTAEAKKTQNPYHQPCFTSYSMQYSQGGGYWQWDHEFNLISHDFGTGDSNYGAWRTYTTAAPEFFESTSSYESLTTDSYVSSNSGYYRDATYMTGYLGHMAHCASGGSSGNAGGWARSGNNGPSYLARSFRDVGVIVGETHQDYAIWGRHNGTTSFRFSVGQRSSTDYYQVQTHGYRNYIDIPTTWTPLNGSSEQFDTGYASVCYNKKAKKLCIIFFDSQGRFVPVVYSNVPDLRAYAHDKQNDWTNQYAAHNGRSDGELYNFLVNDRATNATVYEKASFSPQQQLSGASESKYRPHPVICDNGKVTVYVQSPGWGANIMRWNENGEWEGSGTNDVNNASVWYYGSVGHPTYGYEQGERFGTRWQCTSDGRYVWFNCPYYYYGAGALRAFVRVSDGKILYRNETDSNYGRQSFPVGKCSMGYVYNGNTDSGVGMQVGWTNLEDDFASLADGGQCRSNSFHLAYNFECGYRSTAYPACIPAIYDTSLFSAPHLDLG